MTQVCPPVSCWDLVAILDLMSPADALMWQIFSTVVELQSVSVRLLLSRSLQCNLVATLIIAIPLEGMVTIQN